MDFDKKNNGMEKNYMKDVNLFDKKKKEQMSDFFFQVMVVLKYFQYIFDLIKLKF